MQITIISLQDTAVLNIHQEGNGLETRVKGTKSQGIEGWARSFLFWSKLALIQLLWLIHNSHIECTVSEILLENKKSLKNHLSADKASAQSKINPKLSGLLIQTMTIFPQSLKEKWKHQYRIHCSMLSRRIQLFLKYWWNYL